MISRIRWRWSRCLCNLIRWIMLQYFILNYVQYLSLWPQFWCRLWNLENADHDHLKLTLIFHATIDRSIVHCGGLLCGFRDYNYLWHVRLADKIPSVSHDQVEIKTSDRLHMWLMWDIGSICCKGRISLTSIYFTLAIWHTGDNRQLGSFLRSQSPLIEMSNR